MARKNASKNAVQLEKEELPFFLLSGTPMPFTLVKWCFWKADQIERDFEKMK